MLSKLNRCLIWTSSILGSAILLVGILVATLPTTAKWYANNWLEEQGVASTIKEVSIKLLDGQFRIKSFQAVGPERHKINLGEIFIQVHLRDLLDNKVTIEKIEFSDFYVDIYQQLGKRIKVGGIFFGNADTAEIEAGKKRNETIAWKIVVKEIGFKSVETCVRLHNDQDNLLYNDCLTLGDFALDGKTSYLTYAKAKEPTANLAGDLSFVLNNLRLHDNTDNSDVVNIGALHVKKLAIDGVNKINIDSVKVDNYSVLQRVENISNDDAHIANFEHVTLSKIDIKDLNELFIEDVNIDGLQAYLLRESNGNFEPLRRIQQLLFPETAFEKKISDQAEAKAKPVFKIDELTIGGNSAVTVKDEGIKPPYAGTGRDINVKLAQIDSSNPDNKNPIELSFIAGEHGKVNFSGEVALFAVRPTGKLIGQIRSLNAADFSAYLNSTIQNRITSGQVDADVLLSVEAGQLNSELNFIFHKLYIEELREQEANEYKEKLGVSLSTALGLLREKDDSIHLKIPVTGDIENPDFSLNDAIRKVMMDAIRQAVINYYTPFGLVTIAKAAFNLATALHFEPVAFEPTGTDISDDEKQRLEKLVTLFNERPTIKLLACGHATLDDRFKLFPIDDTLEKKVRSVDPGGEEYSTDITALLPELTEKEAAKLHAIAKLRGENVSDYLVKIKGIDPSRVIMCNPRFTNDQDKPRVTLSL